MNQATSLPQTNSAKQRLLNKSCIITGGTRGIGKAIAELFAREGGRVIITGRSPTNNTAAELNQAINPTHPIQYQACDMNDKAALVALVEQVIRETGSLDVLVNNAGMTKDTLYMRMKEEDWNEVINTNLNAVFHLTQPVIKQMSKQRSGSIINMSSVVGLHGNPAQVNYATTKAGIIGFTKALAKEYGRRGIRVNAIAPGFINTEMTDKLPEEIQNKYKENIPLGEFGTVEDIAEVALFLAASAGYITGQVIQVDGGLFM